MISPHEHIVLLHARLIRALNDLSTARAQIEITYLSDNRITIEGVEQAEAEMSGVLHIVDLLKEYT